MKKEYNIKGLDCGHCALTLEKYLQKVDGVISCNVNFSTSKLLLDIDDNIKNVMKNVYKTIKQVNPTVSISEDRVGDNNTNMFDIILYVIGIILGLAVLFTRLDESANVVYYILLTLAVLLIGYKTFLRAVIQLKHFRINENTLITISVFGAILLGERLEGFLVIALYTLGKMLEAKAVNYSRKSISSLIASSPEFAWLLKDEKEIKVKPETLKVGDKIIVKSGEKIAVDGIVVSGVASVDKKHLTGESVPVSVNTNDYIESGCIVLDSAITIEVLHEYKDSTVAKILNLVSDASSRKSKTETIISKFSNYYTLIVIALSIVTFVITSLVLKDVSEGVYRGLVFLVVSCPCAFAISVPLSYFSGIGRCSKQGILVKGSNYIDAAANINKIFLDKTGTLTTGRFEVSKIVLSSCSSESELLEVVVAGEKNSIHPIAKTICEYYGKDSESKITNYKEITGMGIEYKIGKDKFFVGRGDSSNGETIVVVSKNDEEFGKIYLHDKIKDESIGAIENINKLNIQLMMLTGDNDAVAKKVSKKLGVNSYASQLLPEDKYKIIEEEKNKGNKVAFVGDGINDAPALVMSDVGISMGIMGTPATIESSDIVIADDNLNKLPKLIKISRFTRRIVWGNIVFAISTKSLFLLLGAFGITGMLLAVFADVGVTLLAILNSLRILSYKDK